MSKTRCSLERGGLAFLEMTYESVRSSHISSGDFCEIHLEMISTDTGSCVPLSEHFMGPAEADGRPINIHKGTLEDAETGRQQEALDWCEGG
jgi:hypothetical protein